MEKKPKLHASRVKAKVKQAVKQDASIRDKLIFRIVKESQSQGKPSFLIQLTWFLAPLLGRLFLFFDLLKLTKPKLKNKPKLDKLSLFADNLPITWGKIIKASAADYEERINELWGAGKYRSAKWNQKLAWICALSNLGYYLWLKAWKPVSTVFRRLL
jgi:hypothetical protein